IRCLACGREAEVSDFLAGLVIVCKHCGNRIEIPTNQTKVVNASVAATAIMEIPLNSLNEPSSIELPSVHAVQATTPETPQPIISENFHELPIPRSILQRTADDKPVWAVERAKAMLSLGEVEPRIVKQLVAKGLSEAEATAIVDGLL